MKLFLPLPTLLTLATAASGLRFEPSPLCMNKCPDDEPTVNRPCYPEDLSRCNCVYDDSDCYRCSPESPGSGVGNWSEACAGVIPPHHDHYSVEDPVSLFSSELTMAYSMTPEEEQAAEEEVGMMVMAFEDGRALHAGHEPTASPTGQSTGCDVSACSEMECCGPYSMWDTNALMCVWDPDELTGWDTVTRPDDHTECIIRDCQEETCCGMHLQWDGNGATCTWIPAQWALEDMNHFLDDHYSDNGAADFCADMCHQSEEHCNGMCDTLDAPQPVCTDICFETHVFCHNDCDSLV